ncbi:MAG: hypothetical protein M1814_006311 [Vezdaea aestivalis]|nr:MAG: hypothetical protein M1814_006311 [Vezdaea aestivalis]
MATPGSSSAEVSRQASEDVEMKSVGGASGDGDLFGSGSEKSSPAPSERGSRETSPGETNGVEGEEVEEQERTVFETEIGYHPVPRGDDGETYILKMPTFLSIEPQAFTNQSFQPPTTDHHSTTASPHFSAYDRSMQTIRWRRDPNNPSKIQSNAKINIWSDGSKTLQLSTNPSEQYELVPKYLAPRPDSKKGYNVALDSLTYVTVPHMTAALLGVTNHVTTQLNVLPNKSANDEALIKLQEGLAAAVNKGKGDADGGTRMIDFTEDPELEKKRVEAAEKERLKAQKRRDAAAERDRERTNRLGRIGGPRPKGLSVGMLEDDMDGTGPSPRKRAALPKTSKRQRRDDYDSDDYGPRARTKEDEYDKDDGFLANSDEEPETYEDDELDAEGEEEELEEEGEEERRPAHPTKGLAVGKEPAGMSPAPAGTPDQAAGRGRRRRFVEEDDDDE